MSGPLDWRVGSDGDSQAAVVQLPAQAPLVRHRRPVSALLALLYVLAVLTAAVVGFSLGRWTTARSTYRRAIENEVAVEELAWRHGDASLYATTLDPLLAPQARYVLEEQFRRTAPSAMDMQANGYEVVAPDRVVVDMILARPGGAAVRERREYVLRGATWYRTIAADETGLGAGP